MASRRLTQQERAAAPGHRPACTYCRKAFTPTHGRQIFCGPSCEQEDYKKRKKTERLMRRLERLASGELDRKCVECEQVFRPKIAPRLASTCSPECRKAALKRERAGKFTAARERSAMTLTCGWCAKTFTPKASGKMPGFCSHLCAVRHGANERAKAAPPKATYRQKFHEQAVLRRAERSVMTLTCEGCAGEFTPKGTGRVPRFCSPPCNWKFYAAEKARQRAAEREARDVEAADVQPVLMLERLCGNCTHWAGGSRGCVLEVFRACQPGVLAQHWAAQG